MPDNDRSHLIAEWLKYAEDDELNARAILKDRDGTPAQICFLSQQMAEKYFKALLLHFTGDYPRIHDIRELAVTLDRYEKAVKTELEGDIIFLTPFYVGTRSPADIPLERFTGGSAAQAFAATLRIKEFVLEGLKGSV